MPTSDPTVKSPLDVPDNGLGEWSCGAETRTDDCHPRAAAIRLPSGIGIAIGCSTVMADPGSILYISHTPGRDLSSC